MTSDPVTRLFAPQARLYSVEHSKLHPLGATRVNGRVFGDRAHFQLISATVKLLNTDTSTLKVVLANQRFDDDGLPATPPWKYNGLDWIKFGQHIRLDMRYGDEPWTKMFLGQVNDMEFAFPHTGKATVTVHAEDLLCLLKRKPAKDIAHKPGHEDALVTKTLEEAGKPFEFAGKDPIEVAREEDGSISTRGSLVEWPDFKDKLPKVTHQKSQTFLKFLQSHADRMDFEVFVDFARNYLPDGGGVRRTDGSPTDMSSEVLLHFEPARSLRPARNKLRVVDLVWGENLVDFSPKLMLFDLFTSVTVKGRKPASVKRIDRTIDAPDEIDDVIREDLQSAPPEPGEPSGDERPAKTIPIPSSELRRRYFRDLPSEKQEAVDVSNLDEERAVLKAKTELRRRARQAVTGTCTTIGCPSLRPGMYVNLRKLHAPFDGMYYVTSAEHVFEETGYTTKVGVRRPGLLNPDAYPGSLTELVVADDLARTEDG